MTERDSLEIHWVLTPYDLDSTCPKCSFETVSTKYHSGGVESIAGCYTAYKERADKEPYDTVSSYNFPEHFDRGCKRCSYQWAEGMLK